MKKIVDYLIVEANDRDELSLLVNENIKDWGWQPFGSLQMNHYVNDGGEIWGVYAQAMVKYED